MKKEKVAIFDFCDTLVDFQTADAYVDFVRETKRKFSIVFKYYLFNFLSKIRFLDALEFLTHWRESIHKRFYLWQLKGVSEAELELLSLRYYNERVRTHLIDQTISLLKEYQSRNIQIWIVSGGYSIYLKHFVREFDVDRLICSNIKMKNGKCIGKLDGLDCLNDNKVVLLKDAVPNYNEYIFIASLSDSITDIPILSFAHEGIVISHSPQLWAKEKCFNEIII